MWRRYYTQSYLESYLPSCHSVCPAVSRSGEQAFYRPFRKHRYSTPLVLTTSHFLLTVSYFVESACAGVSHCWRVAPHAILWSGWRIDAEQTFTDRLVQKPFSASTVLPSNSESEVKTQVLTQPNDYESYTHSGAPNLNIKTHLSPTNTKIMNCDMVIPILDSQVNFSNELLLISHT
jgi:hypothetical protein